MKTTLITTLLIACGFLFGCDEDNAGDDSAESAAEESSSSDDGASDDDSGSTGELEPWDAEVQRCAEIVDCVAADCDAERDAYATCRAENAGNFEACSFKLDDVETCSTSCAEPIDSECPYEGQECTGPYGAAWFAASECLLEQPGDCELDGLALCHGFYGT